MMASEPPRPHPATGWLSLRAVARSLAPGTELLRRTDIPRRPGSRRLVLAGALACMASFGGAALWHSAQARTRSAHLVPVISSGTAGFKTTPSGALERWGGGAVTVYIDDSVDRLGAGAHDAVERGFGTWLASARHLPRLRFDTTHHATPSLVPDGKSTVMVAEIPFAGHTRDLAITVGFMDPATGKLAEADIVLNARYKWGVLDAAGGPATHDMGDDPEAGSGLSCNGSHPDTSCGGRYDVQDIATHEIGHFFGLGEDNEDPAATMFKCSSVCEIHKRDLETDDDSAIGTLYATADTDAAATSPASCDVSHAGSSSGPAWLLVCLGVAAGVAVRRRYSVQSTSLGPMVR